jgi:phenylacetate-coenzyme A ligase PaaK-like adenylate-forming protein
MTVRVEVQKNESSLEGLKEHLEKRLHADLAVKVGVELVPDGSLAEFSKPTGEGKAKRLLDRRYQN